MRSSFRGAALLDSPPSAPSGLHTTCCCAAEPLRGRHIMHSSATAEANCLVIRPAVARISCHCASHSPMLCDVGSLSGMRASVTAHVRPLTRMCIGQAARAPAPFTHQATRAPAPFTHQAKAAWAAAVPDQVSPAKGGGRCCARHESDLLVRPTPPPSLTPTLLGDLSSYLAWARETIRPCQGPESGWPVSTAAAGAMPLAKSYKRSSALARTRASG